MYFTDSKTKKPKPVLKRTETYEDRCRLLIGMPENPTAPTTTRQRSEDNLTTPKKPLKGVHPVVDDTDTTRTSSFTKATSDITFDKKTLRTAQVTVDKDTNKKPIYKTELKRTISPVDEANDEKNVTHKTETTRIVNIEDDKTFSSDTLSFSLKKVKPSDTPQRDHSPQTDKPRFTSHETETVTVTRTNDKPIHDVKRPAGRRTTDYTSTTEDEEYSSTIKSRTEKRTSTTETDKHRQVPKSGPTKPSDMVDKHERPTYKTTETVEINQKTVDDVNKRPTNKKPLKKGPRFDTDTDEEEVITTEHDETEQVERRTSSYADDTISSTLKKTDATFEYHSDSVSHQYPDQPGARKPSNTQRPEDEFITNEKIHSTNTTSDSVTKIRSTESQPRDKSPYTGSRPSDERFTKYETETVKITRTSNDDTDQKVTGKTPLKKGPKLDTDTEEDVVTEHEESSERRTSSYYDDTISSTLKKVDTTFEYNPEKPEYGPEDDFISKERMHSVTTETDSRPSNHPSFYTTTQPRDKSPYTGSKTGSDKFTKYETETVKITRTVEDQKDQKPTGKKPVLKKGEQNYILMGKLKFCIVDR